MLLATFARRSINLWIVVGDRDRSATAPRQGRRRTLLLLALAGLVLTACGGPPSRPLVVPAAPQLRLPAETDSLRFAVIGDSGTGRRAQYEVGAMMAAVHSESPLELVLMLGDNLYGSEDPEDYEDKFERPYARLLDKGVKFYAALGNHDDVAQIDYPAFNMAGRRYYSFQTEGHSVRFFALDSFRLDKAQLRWLEKELRNSRERWKICFLHHPVYSSGGRGIDEDLREMLEPLFVAHSVGVVLSGHDHFYERTKSQKNVTYFVVGAAGKHRGGDIQWTELTARGFNVDNSFLLVEITDDALHFQALSRTGITVDTGLILPNPGSEREPDR